MNWREIQFFGPHEFACSCCGEERMQLSWMITLDMIRKELGTAMIVTSGYRCKNHPVEAAKRVPGTHNQGLATDLSMYGSAVYQLLSLLHKFPGVTGVGLKQHGDIEERFIHLDGASAAQNRPRPHIWTYA